MCGGRVIGAAVAIAVRRQPKLCGGSCSLCTCILILCLHFAGKRVVYPPNKEGDSAKELYVGLNCSKVKTLGGFQLSKDDPTRYRDKQDFLCQDRAFPNQEYPEGADIDQVVVVSQKAGTSSSMDIQVEQRQKSRELLIKMHSELSKMARQMGVKDLCAAEKSTRVENVLAGITKDNLDCNYCQKHLSSVTHLKNHIKKWHLHVTPHKCDQCNTYFSEASTLKRHEPIHDEDAPRYRCTKKVQKSKKDPTLVECGKEFPSQSKLLDHQDVHTEGPLIYCEFCKVKGYKRMRGVKAHDGHL